MARLDFPRHNGRIMARFLASRSELAIDRVEHTVVAHFDDAFKVTWEDSEDAKSIWAIDRVHFAQPVPPLGEDFYSVIVEAGWNTRAAFANGYLFMKDFRPPPTPPEVEQEGPAKIWQERYLPIVRSLCAEIRNPNYDSMDAAEIVAKLPEIFQASARAFRYPTVVASSFMAPTLQMVVLCEQELGEDGPVEAVTLLQGVQNESAAAGSGLGEMALYAAQHPALAAALTQRRFDQIAGAEGSAQFLRLFHAFLENYGWRANEWCRLHMPTWAEDPAIPLEIIARYLEDPSHAPAQAQERSIRLREEAAARIETRLPAGKRDEFQALLSAALAHVPISEERALWQLIAVGSARMPLMALGRKLSATGVIEQPADVFFLRLAELAVLAAEPQSVTGVVEQRRTAFEHYQTLEPPQSIGAPLVLKDRPGPSQVIHRYFFGTITPPSDQTTIRGQGASQGIVTGRARIVRDLGEASRLEQGDVLICKATAPPWTPLFAIASGVVTDSGGILSHSAICAREYGIPCVVGTQDATALIPDGAMITVDGTKGTVTVNS